MLPRVQFHFSSVRRLPAKKLGVIPEALLETELLLGVSDDGQVKNPVHRPYVARNSVSRGVPEAFDGSTSTVDVRLYFDFRLRRWYHHIDYSLLRRPTATTSSIMSIVEHEISPQHVNQ